MKQLPITLRPSLTTGQTSLPLISINYSLKTFLFFLFFISIATASSGQQLDSTQHNKSSIDLLQKSKTQQTWGWILTGAGIAGLVATLAVETAGETWVDLIWEEEEDMGNYTAPYVVSAAAIAGGVTLFVAASRNKKRAAASVVYLKMEDATALKRLGFNEKPFPSVALRFKLSR